MSNSTSSSKRVTFNPRVTGVEITSIYDYTPKEISAMWFDQNEMERIAQKCYRIIMRMQDGAPCTAKKYCTRGLEGHSRLGSLTRKRNRKTSIAAVLMEQSQQWIDNKVDEDAIAEAYRRMTASCQMRAQVMGKRDQEAATAILREGNDEVEAETNVTVSPSTSNESLLVPCQKATSRIRKSQSSVHRIPLPSGTRAV